MEFVFFLLACSGMCQIMIDGSIMQWFRDLVEKISIKIKTDFFKDLFSCYLCLGTWVGFLIGGIMQPLGNSLHWLPQTILCGFVSGSFNLTLNSVLNYIWGLSEKLSEEKVRNETIWRVNNNEPS